MSAARAHAVPGGGSALKPPPQRDLAPAPQREAPPAAPERLTAPSREVEPAAGPEQEAVTAPVRDSAPPPPPPAARKHSREQLNTKIRVDLRGRLDAFVEIHDSTLQGVMEAALDEYMARRGYTWDDHRKAQRRR
jgi:hypothetical protein